MKIVGILAAAMALQACAGGSAPEANYDLIPYLAHGRPLAGQRWSIDAPATGPGLESQRILVRESEQRLAVLAGAQWAAPLPELVAKRVQDSLDAAGAIATVGAGYGGERGRIALDIRHFELDVPAMTVRVEIAAFRVGLGGAAPLGDYTADTPVASTSPADVAAALDLGFQRVGQAMVARLAGR